MNQAIVSVDRGCGIDWGDGRYVFLLKENGIWKISSTDLLWES